MTTKDLIESLISDKNYKIKPEGKILTLITVSGKKSVKGIWRETGRIKTTTSNGHTQSYKVMKYKNVDIPMARVIYRKFKGKLDDAKKIDYKDNNTLNIHKDNLELVTMSTLNKRQYLEGRLPTAGNAKLTYEDAQQIRKSEEKSCVLAKKYNVSEPTICEVRKNIIWKPKDQNQGE